MTLTIGRFGRALALMILLLWALSGGVPWVVAAEDSQGLSLFDVKISAASFNPSLGDTVSLTYQLSRSAKVTIKVFDPDQELIRVLISDASREGGPHEEAWDGKDDAGAIVPNEAYFFTIVAEEPSSSQQVVYDPITFSGGEQFDLGQAHLNREDGTLTYKLSQPSRVLIRIGVAKSALLKTLVDWEPRVAGEITEYWNGKDENNLVDVWTQKFSTVITYFTLPDSSVITVGNSNTSYRAYKTGLTEPRPKKDTRPFSNRRNISPHFLASRLTDRTFTVQLTFPELSQPSDQEVSEGTQQLLVRVDVGPEGRQVLANEQFEIIVFVDHVFFAEEERGYLPFNYPLELSQFPPGDHILTLNIATFHDHFGVGTRKFSIRKK